MIDRLLHTPDGVRDLLSAECQKKQSLEKIVHQVFTSYGYQDLETPTFEFFDVFGREIGTTPSRELYKLFDRDGETLVLRPDFTPAVARAASKYFSGETLAVRLCCKGNTFINSTSYQGHLKEVTHMDAELLGEESPEADAELIAMTIDLLLSAGLTEFQVSIGHVGFFGSLMKEAGLTEEEEKNLRSLITMKNYFGVEEYLEQRNLSGELKEILKSLPELFGNGLILKKAAQLTKNAKALRSIQRLEEILEILTLFGLEKYVSFDLGMLSNYQYYTGIIFRGFTFGTGDAVVKGGRYDHLLEQFGKKKAAIGFAVVIDQLLSALNRQKIDVPIEDGPTLLLYKRADRKGAFTEARALRKQGCKITLMEQTEALETYQAYGKRNGFYAVRVFRPDDSLAL